MDNIFFMFVTLCSLLGACGAVVYNIPLLVGHNEAVTKPS